MYCLEFLSKQCPKTLLAQIKLRGYTSLSKLSYELSLFIFCLYNYEIIAFLYFYILLPASFQWTLLAIAIHLTIP